jgi:drug/metabolite transporter (DMT)-like permease
VLLTIFFWGISFVATKVAVKEISPITLATIRFLLSFVILKIIFRISRKDSNLSREDRKNAIFAGFWGVTMYFIFENVGVKFTTPSQASLLISTVPIFTMVIQDVQRRKLSSLLSYLLSFVSLLGVALIVFSNGVEFNYGMMGNIFELLAAFSWGMYTLYVDKLGKTDNFLSTVEMTKWGMFFLFPFSIAEYSIAKPKLSYMFQPNVFLWILFLGIVCSGLGYVMWNHGIKTLGSRTTSNLLYLIPLVSVIADSWMLKNPPSLIVYLGGGLIMFGVIVGEKLATREALTARA